MGSPAREILKVKSPPKRLMKQIRQLHETGHFKKCLSYCEKLVSNGYQHPELLFLLGRSQRGLGNLNGALVAIHAAVERQPENTEYLIELGTVFFDMKEHETAIELFKNATKLDDKCYEAWKRLGVALRIVNRLEAAELAFTYARHIDPTQIEPVINLVIMLNQVQAYDKAQVLLDDLLKNEKNHTPSILLKRLHVAARQQDVDYLEANYSLIDREGLSLDEQAELDNLWAFYLDLHFRHDEAIEILEKWAFRDTSHRDLIVSFLGLIYAISGKLEKGIELQRKILAENPDNVAGRYNLADLILRNGEVKESFELFEARWEWWGFPSKRRIFDAPRWNGEDLTNKNLLVWREQGIGDEITYASLLDELKPLGANITFECSPKLKPIWENSFPWLTIRDDGPEDCRSDENYEAFDYQIPMASLTNHFREDINAFVEKQKPWIKRDVENENRIRDQIGIEENEILVGICLRSGHQNAARNPSFLTNDQFKALNALPNIKWLNLQYDNTQEEIDELRTLGFDLHHYENLDQKQDMVGAARLIGACDIVISVGVSVGDIACGLGVPTVHIAREHSAAYMGTEFLPWLPSARAYQMPPNGGEGAIGKVLEDWPEILNWAAKATNSNRPIPHFKSATEDNKSIQRKAVEDLNLSYQLNAD